MPKKVVKKPVLQVKSGQPLDEYHSRLVMLFLVGVCFFLLAYTMMVVV
jgi:hypothetical protein